MPSKETPSKSNKFALVTLHPWLPSEATQIAQARTWGIPEDLLGEADVSPVFVEDVRKAKRTTNWPGKLPLRADFFKRMAALKLNGGQVFSLRHSRSGSPRNTRGIPSISASALACRSISTR